MTVMLRCLNCGFSFTVTFPSVEPPLDKTRPVVCGHCRSTHWSSQTFLYPSTSRLHPSCVS